MGFGSIWPWVIVLAIVLLLFGRGRISGLMGDVANGVKSFRRGIADDRQPPMPLIENQAGTAPAAPETPERSNAAD